MTHDLGGLNVLVTRPRPEGVALSECIRSANGNAIYFPTIEIKPPQDLLLLPTQLKQLEQLDWLIFISPQAVYAFANYFSGEFPKQLKVAALGPGTAKALTQANLPVHCYPTLGANSEALLALPEFSHLAHKKIALIRGQGGREKLAQELSLRGAQVMHIIVYQRVEVTVDVREMISLLQTQQVDIIVTTSNDILQHLVALLNKQNLVNIPLVVISERMRLYAKQLGFNKIIVANNASHHAIMDTLRGFLWQKK